MLPPLLKAVARMGYQVFDGNHAFNLNLIGIRTSNRNQTEDLFDDWLTCTYRERVGGSWHTHWWRCTTDPGKQALLHPELYNADGTAIMAPGQYRAAYTIGMHRNKYEALVQRGPGPVSFYRDSTGDAQIDMDPARLETGYIGANIHKAGRDSERISGVSSSGKVWSWSAGCQVLKKELDFVQLLDLAHLQIEHHPKWKTFTYTLINEEDLL